MMLKCHRLFALGRAELFMMLICVAALLVLRPDTSIAQGIPALSSAVQIGSDNVVNTGGPSIVYFNGMNEILYSNHSNQHLFADPGVSGHPTDTGIVVGGSGQVKATVFNNTLYVSYVGPSGIFLATSTDGINFPTQFTPAYSCSVSTAYTPTPYAFNGELWVAYVSGADVCFDESPDGVNFFGMGSEFTYAPVSTISLTQYNGTLYAAFITDTGASPFPTSPVFGAVQSGDFFLLTSGALSNSHTKINGSVLYAGVALIGVPGEGIYLYGQSPASEQNIWVTATADPPDFPANVKPSGQSFRWDLSAVLDPNNTVYLAYQQSGATNIDTTFVTGYGSPF